MNEDQERIALLGRQLHESSALSITNTALALGKLAKMQPSKGSALVVTLTWLGGKEVCPPFAVEGGLSKNTIAALHADLEHSIAQSLELASAFAGRPLASLQTKEPS